jgi:hypothetical protein
LLRRQGYLEYLNILFYSATIGKLRKEDPAALPLHKPLTRSQTQARNNLVSEPSIDMAEKDLKALEERIAERITNQMEEMFGALSLQFQQFRADDHANHASSSKNQSGKSGRPDSGNSFPKVAKLNFPKFDGFEDSTNWVCRAEQFFEFQGTTEEDKVALAAYHLEGEAQLWYQLFKESEEHISWEAMKDWLHVRYGATQFDDFFGDLTKLRQTGTVREYQGQYERLLSRAGRLSVTQQVSGFISGLKESIRPEVQASGPSTLTAAVGLARLYEARLLAQRRPTNLYDTQRTMG